jgi:HPt (histidine-containing phosphotransfer) domain-containing protein
MSERAQPTSYRRRLLNFKTQTVPFTNPGGAFKSVMMTQKEGAVPALQMPLPGATSDYVAKPSFVGPLLTPIDIDRATPSFALNSEERNKFLKELVEDRLANDELGDGEEQALAFLHSRILEPEAISEAEKEFWLDFLRWCVGKPRLATDVVNTPWLARPTRPHHDNLTFWMDDVYRFVTIFDSTKRKFDEQLTNLEIKGPTSLNEAYLYYKYIVRKANANFLDDVDLLGPIVGDGRGRRRDEVYRDERVAQRAARPRPPARPGPPQAPPAAEEVVAPQMPNEAAQVIRDLTEQVAILTRENQNSALVYRDGARDLSEAVRALLNAKVDAGLTAQQASVIAQRVGQQVDNAVTTGVTKVETAVKGVSADVKQTVPAIVNAVGAVSGDVRRADARVTTEVKAAATNITHSLDKVDNSIKSAAASAVGNTAQIVKTTTEESASVKGAVVNAAASISRDIIQSSNATQRNVDAKLDAMISVFLNTVTQALANNSSQEVAQLQHKLEVALKELASTQLVAADRDTKLAQLQAAWNELAKASDDLSGMAPVIAQWHNFYASVSESVKNIHNLVPEGVKVAELPVLALPQGFDDLPRLDQIRWLANYYRTNRDAVPTAIMLDKLSSILSGISHKNVEIGKYRAAEEAKEAAERHAREHEEILDTRKQLLSVVTNMHEQASNLPKDEQDVEDFKLKVRIEAWQTYLHKEVTTVEIANKTIGEVNEIVRQFKILWEKYMTGGYVPKPTTNTLPGEGSIPHHPERFQPIPEVIPELVPQPATVPQLTIDQANEIKQMMLEHITDLDRKARQFLGSNKDTAATFLESVQPQKWEEYLRSIKTVEELQVASAQAKTLGDEYLRLLKIESPDSMEGTSQSPPAEASAPMAVEGRVQQPQDEAANLQRFVESNVDNAVSAAIISVSDVMAKEEMPKDVNKYWWNWLMHHNYAGTAKEARDRILYALYKKDPRSVYEIDSQRLKQLIRDLRRHWNDFRKFIITQGHKLGDNAASYYTVSLESNFREYIAELRKTRVTRRTRESPPSDVTEEAVKVEMAKLQSELKANYDAALQVAKELVVKWSPDKDITKYWNAQMKDLYWHHCLEEIMEEQERVLLKEPYDSKYVIDKLDIFYGRLQSYTKLYEQLYAHLYKNKDVKDDDPTAVDLHSRIRALLGGLVKQVQEPEVALREVEIPMEKLE